MYFQEDCSSTPHAFISDNRVTDYNFQTKPFQVNRKMLKSNRFVLYINRIDYMKFMKTTTLPVTVQKRTLSTLTSVPPVGINSS